MDIAELESRTAAYARGVAAAEARFGDECRHFDRAIWGMAEVMSAHGRDLGEHSIDNPVFGDFVSRWHTPLAMANAETDFNFWLKAFPAWYRELKDSYEVRTLFENRTSWRYRHLEGELPLDLGTESGQRWLTQQTDETLDLQIKRAFPKLRRNMKRYRELADSKRALAESWVKEGCETKRQRILGQMADYYVREDVPFFDTLRKQADGLEARAIELRILNPDCEVATAYFAYVDKLRTKLTAEMAYRRKWLTSLGVELPAEQVEEACVA